MLIAGRLSLFLLMLGVGADDAHDSFAAHDLAVLTNPSDAGSDFHSGTFSTKNPAARGESIFIAENL
jgi:hypothetical protein